MLRISWQTLRARRGTLAGAFVAIWLAVTLASAAGALLAGALSAPGPGRFAGADAVVSADPSVPLPGGEGEDLHPAPRLDGRLADRVASVAGVRRAIADIAFPVGAWKAGGQAVGRHLQGRSWGAAALTPYTLGSGRRPVRPTDVVADDASGLKLGALLRVAAPAGADRYRVTGLAHRARG